MKKALAILGFAGLLFQAASAQSAELFTSSVSGIPTGGAVMICQPVQVQPCLPITGGAAVIPQSGLYAGPIVQQTLSPAELRMMRQGKTAEQQARERRMGVPTGAAAPVRGYW